MKKEAKQKAVAKESPKKKPKVKVVKPAAAKEDAGVFGGDEDESKSEDPYNSDELSKEDLSMLDSFAEEE